MALTRNQKLWRLGLTISFALNLVIACWALHLARRVEPAVAVDGKRPPEGARDLTAAGQARVPAKPILPKAGRDFGNLDNLASDLRLRGYRPAMVHAIVEAVVDEKLAGQRMALLNLEARRPYWVTDFDVGMLGETLKARREYYVDRGKLLQSVLGDQALVPDDETRERQRIYLGDIPSEKIAAIETIHRDYEDLKENLRAGHFGSENRDDMANTRNLVREMEADIKKTLTEREYVEYAVRNSPTAEWMRGRLARFSPTESEFRELFRALDSAERDGPAGTAKNTAPDTAQLLAEAKRIMPADRFAALEKSLRRTSWPH